MLSNCCVNRFDINKINIVDKNNLKQGPWVEVNHEGDEERILISLYKNNNLNGQYREYYVDGTLRGKGKYCNGKRVGRWDFYLENGDLILWKTYDKNGNELKIGRISLKW